MPEKNIVLYTANFAKRDTFREQPASEHYDFRCITDNKDLIGHPNVIYTPLLVPGDPVRSARLVKCMPHLFMPAYRWWIWIDGSFDFTGADRVLALVGSVQLLATFKHRQRICAYAEALECLRLGLDDREVLVDQMLRYWKDGYEEGAGLSETGALIRFNHKAVIEFNCNWWEELCVGSRRDQISIGYAARKAGILPEHSIGTIFDNPWFTYRSHG